MLYTWKSSIELNAVNPDGAHEEYETRYMEKKDDVILSEGQSVVRKEFQLGPLMAGKLLLSSLLKGDSYFISSWREPYFCYATWATHLNKWLSVAFDDGINRIIREKYKSEAGDQRQHVAVLQWPWFMPSSLCLLLKFKLGVGLESGMLAFIVVSFGEWNNYVK